MNIRLSKFTEGMNWMEVTLGIEAGHLRMERFGVIRRLSADAMLLCHLVTFVRSSTFYRALRQKEKSDSSPCLPHSWCTLTPLLLPLRNTELRRTVRMMMSRWSSFTVVMSYDRHIRRKYMLACAHLCDDLQPRSGVGHLHKNRSEVWLSRVLHR